MRQYWIVDPEEDAVEVWRFGEGRPEQDRFTDRLERAETIAGVQEGLTSMERGEGRPLEEVLEAIRGG